jgi:ABC-type multidrug transport system fused ATPase/permease subunit
MERPKSEKSKYQTQLSEIVKRFRGGISFALSLVVIENVAWILEPSIFGIVIDAMIEANPSGPPNPSIPPTSYVPPLLLWIFVFAVNSGVGAFRRSIDQKIFLRIFVEIATDVARMGKEHKLSASKTAARAELSREYINFFEYRVPEILQQIIEVVGALIGMAFYDWRISGACMVVVFPFAIVTSIYNKRVIVFQKSFHDQFEDVFEVFSSKDPEQIRSYYKALAVPQQKIANWGARTFGMMRFFLLGIFLVVLYIAIDLDDFSTGSIFSIVAYLWTFVTSTEYMPELMESWTSLRDISARLRTETV